MSGSLQAARGAAERLITLTGQVTEDDLVETLFGNQIFSEERLRRRRLASLHVSGNGRWGDALGRGTRRGPGRGRGGELTGLVVFGDNPRFHLVEGAAHQI